MVKSLLNLLSIFKRFLIDQAVSNAFYLTEYSQQVQSGKLLKIVPCPRIKRLARTQHTIRQHVKQVRIFGDILQTFRCNTYPVIVTSKSDVIDSGNRPNVVQVFWKNRTKIRDS
uniref:Uncharacterized protein n=1 Tax=Anopheles culicifacies TaxID=139723 RepID=A0A182M970_9DIPT